MRIDFDQKAFGEALKKRKAELRWSEEALIAKTGVAKTTLHRLMYLGRIRALDSILSICAATGLDHADFTKDNGFSSDSAQSR